MGFGLGLLNGFEFGLIVECGNGVLSIWIGPRRAWVDWVKWGSSPVIVCDPPVGFH